MADVTTGKETLYKVLGADRQSTHGGSGGWEPGEWRAVDLPLIPCVRGLHVCALAHLPLWLGPAIWEVEVAGERLDLDDKIVVERARITRRVKTWNARTARLFVTDCAEHVLPLFERDYPDDDRPRQAIAIARAYANGEATDGELAGARMDAWDASDVDGDVACYVAGAAAQAAARSPEWAMAARHATGAEAAARTTGKITSRCVAWTAERRWQADRLGAYLRGEVAR